MNEIAFPSLVVTVWALPLLTIALDNKVIRKEKSLWIIACIFVSWAAWIAYYFLAPVMAHKSRPGSPAIFFRVEAAFVLLARRLHIYRWSLAALTLAAAAGVLYVTPGIARSALILTLSWAALLLIIWTAYRTENTRQWKGFIPVFMASTLTTGLLYLSVAAVFLLVSLFP